MGSSKHAFKKDDDEDDYDGIENELDDEEVVIGVAEIQPENLDTDDSLSAFDEEGEDTSDEDFEPDNEEDADSESDSSSIRSLRAGREANDEDDLIKRIKEAKKVKRQQPPDIMNDDVVTNISFSPADDVIAVGTMEGDICL